MIEESKESQIGIDNLGEEVYDGNSEDSEGLDDQEEQEVERVRLEQQAKKEAEE